MNYVNVSFIFVFVSGKSHPELARFETMFIAAVSIRNKILVFFLFL